MEKCHFLEDHDVGFEVDTSHHISRNNAFPAQQFTMPSEHGIVILTNNIMTV